MPTFTEMECESPKYDLCLNVVYSDDTADLIELFVKTPGFDEILDGHLVNEPGVLVTVILGEEGTVSIVLSCHTCYIGMQRFHIFYAAPFIFYPSIAFCRLLFLASIPSVITSALIQLLTSKLNV